MKAIEMGKLYLSYSNNCLKRLNDATIGNISLKTLQHER